jgi:tetratricopeptide (TPR) repeat protein
MMQSFMLTLREEAMGVPPLKASRLSPILNRTRRYAAIGTGALRAGALGLFMIWICRDSHPSQNAIQPTFPRGQSQKAAVRSLIDLGLFSQVEELLNEQIKKGSDPLSDYVWLGHLELRRGRTFASIRAYRQAEALQPRNGEIHRLLASDYYLLNQRGLFKEEIQDALTSNPNDPQTNYLAGRFTYEVDKNFGAAADYLLKASRLNPGDYKAGYYLALSFVQLNRPEDAQSQFAHACDLVESSHSKYTAPFRGIAEVFLEKGESASALSYIRRALRVDPGDAEICYLEAKALLQLGHTDDAIDALKRSATLDPSWAEPVYLLGTTYAKIGLHAMSEQAFTRFRQIQEEYGKN